MKALVVGGTGPTGPSIVNGLLDRGYDVTLLHRGTHEVEEIYSKVEHIHADPHFLEPLERALVGRHFDVTVATYGRLSVVAEALVGRTDNLISIGAVLAYAGAARPSVYYKSGLPVAINESWSLVDDLDGDATGKIVAAEQAVFKRHQDGGYRVTHLRYPYVYGPRQLVPKEWLVLRRILDGRDVFLLPDDGLFLCSHGYAENLAHAVLLAVDKPDIARGKTYNVGDEYTYTMRQWVEAIKFWARSSIEVISVPSALVPNIQSLQQFTGSYHRVFSIDSIKSDLGYQDVVSFEDAIGVTVDWLRQNQPQKGGQVELALNDSFDYRAEDVIIRRYKELLISMEEQKLVFGVQGMRYHPYPHPKQHSLESDHRSR